MCGIADFVDQIATDHDETWTEAIDVGDHELVVGRLLREVSVVGEHSKLRVRELDEEIVACGILGGDENCGDDQDAEDDSM